MASDEEDFVFHGTPIEREEEMTSRRKKAVAEASGNLRSVVPWKQEVTDEEGRRRFHGAFTGGFSAGYHNTVGSKEGWTPKTFTSSRKNRAEFKQQDVLNFLDDDEKEELEGRSLGTSMKFDTFGFTAAELARKQADKEQQQRPSVIPGPAPDELVVPTSDSIGVKLLLKMGWRHGHAIKDSRANSLYDARREARKAFLAFSSDEKAAHRSGSEPVQGDFANASELPTDKDHELPRSTPVYVQNPKQDLHGLGYDPFKHAPEFRENKRSRLHENKELGRRKPLSMKDSLLAFRSERAAPGFGIGALEELDIEDEDVYASGYAFEETYLQDIEEPSMLTIEDKKKSSARKDGVLPGFKLASNTDYQLERFDPPIIPKDFQPHHIFPAPLDSIRKFSVAPPSDVPPPDDKNLKILIDGVATMIARSGKLFEDLSREKNQSNPLFSFLNGGDGHAYYTRRLWEEREKRNDKKGQQMDNASVFADKQKLTAENRGNILGEKPLERSSKDTESALLPADVQLQFNLSDTFTKSDSFSKLADVSKPYQDDPAKQERFEQFLKEKYHGGLRTKDSGGSSNMSEATRARERLEFEAAALALEKGNWRNEGAVSNKHLLEISVGSGLQFTPSTKEQANEAEELLRKMYPKREEFQWYPSSILCKRFDITDPYQGKPPPPPRARSKMDSLIFMPNSVAPSKVEETGSSSKNSLPGHTSGTGEMNNEADEKVEVEVENVERPVDLYKAIFSDDSDNEEESSTTLKPVEDPHKKNEVANTALSRLIAGDFLESLGKELGLEVPPDQPYVDNRAKGSSNNREDTANGIENKPQPESKPFRRETVVDGRSSGGNMMKTEGSAKEISGGTEVNREGRVEKNPKTHSDRRRYSSSSSSEDDRKRKRSKRRRHRRSESDSDASYSSDDDRERRHSRSKRKKGSSSKEKSSRSSSRKHSKHHQKHRREESDSRTSRRDSERDRETKRERRR